MKMYESAFSKTAHGPEERKRPGKNYVDMDIYLVVRECIRQGLLVWVPSAIIWNE